MKKYTLWLAVILVAAMAGCNKIKDALFPTIAVDLPPVQFTVPAFPLVLPTEATLGSFSMPFNLDSLVRANTAGAFGAGAVSSVKIKKMVICIDNGDAINNLANFKTARFVLSSDAEAMPAEVINISIADSATQSITVQPADTPELKPYLLGNQLTYTLYGQARRPTTKALQFNIAITLSAK